MTQLVERLVPPDLLALLRSLAGDRELWLVGGALRDHFLGRNRPDLDFVVDREAGELARAVANRLGAGLYAMDPDRDAARVILPGQGGTLDFARQLGSSIESDLQARDFTINALALPLRGDERLIDPLGGLQDLRERRLRAGAKDAVLADPIRGLRAVRLASQLGLHMDPDTVRQVRSAADHLGQVSPERVRDELLRALTPPSGGTAARLMDQLGLLTAACPELERLPGRRPGDPLPGLDRLGRLMELGDLWSRSPAGERTGNLALAELALRLGPHRAALGDHLARRERSGRQAFQLLALAALFSPNPREPGEPPSDAAAAAALAAERAQQLRLSRREAAQVERIVLNGWRPESLGRGGLPGDGAIYRFFRATGASGVEVVLLYLAGSLVRLGSAPPAEEWGRIVELGRLLLEAWFDRRAEVIQPPKLIAGDELAAALGLRAGLQIGELLEAIRQAQAEGQVRDRQAAVEWARRQLRAGPLEVKDKSRSG